MGGEDVAKIEAWSGRRMKIKGDLKGAGGKKLKPKKNNHTYVRMAVERSRGSVPALMAAGCACHRSANRRRWGQAARRGRERRDAGGNGSSPGASFFTGPLPNLVAQAIVSVTPRRGRPVCWLTQAARCSQKSMQGDKHLRKHQKPKNKK